MMNDTISQKILFIISDMQTCTEMLQMYPNWKYIILEHSSVKKRKSCCTIRLPVGASAPTEEEIWLFLAVFTVRQVLAGPTV